MTIFPLSSSLHHAYKDTGSDQKSALHEIVDLKKQQQSVSYSLWNQAHITPRGKFFVIGLSFIPAAVIDILLGIILVVTNICTLGFCGSLPGVKACKLLKKGGKTLLARPFKAFIQTLNPGATFGKLEDGSNPSKIISQYIGTMIKNAHESDNPFIAHGLGRLMFLIYGIALFATRLLALVWGIFCCAVSLVTLGNVKWANQGAYYGLQFPKIIHVFAITLLGIIHFGLLDSYL